MKDEMMHYGVTCGMRFTKNQKQFFLEEAMQQAKQSKKPSKLQSNGKVANLWIGDCNSKMIIACAYDTPGKSLFLHSKYFPFNDKKNTEQSTYQLIIRTILFLVVMAMGIGFFLWNKKVEILPVVVMGVALLACTGFGFVLLREKPNKVNFNRNSAAVAVLMSLVKDKSFQSTVVFMDKAVSSKEGQHLLKEEVSDEQTVVFLDAVSSGEQLVFAHTENIDGEMIFEKEFQLSGIVKKYDSESKNVLTMFNRAIMITTGKINKKQFVVDNVQSSKDIGLDLERLLKIRDSLKCYSAVQERSV
ncbi:MAG: hypothetical protein ACK5LZ_00660 [Anaerorhabdus sp.]